MIPTNDPYYSIVTMYNANNSKISGGTILGDRYTHDYGMRINENGNELEFGEIDTATGELVESTSWIRTKDYITNYIDWTTKQPEPFPNAFMIMPLEKTKYNTVDGGVRYVFCYDDNNNYLGQVGGGNFTNKISLLAGTTKIKISFRGEDTLDGVYYITKNTTYPSHEFGSGLMIGASDNVEINGTIIKDCVGDCICTIAPPIKVTVNKLKVLNCTLENSRRQGISFVATGENCIVRGCNIGKINGVDPQCGIDIEHYDYVKNTVIDNCNFYDNKKWDIIEYNGTYTTVKNSHFESGIATTYGHHMTIYNNEFEYKDSAYVIKRYPNTCINLGTIDNIVYNNTFKNGTIINSGKNSILYNNIFTDCNDVKLTAPGSNKFYNSSIRIKNTIDLTFENMYFNNSSITCDNVDSRVITINNSTFEDSVFCGGGENIINDSIFNLTQSKFIDSTTVANITYNRCNITSMTERLWWNTFMAKSLTFNNCDIDCGNGNIVNYGSINFNACNFLFRNRVENNGCWNIGGYGYEKCPWAFVDCIFDSEVPLKIGDTITNPTIIKNITI